MATKLAKNRDRDLGHLVELWGEMWDETFGGEKARRRGQSPDKRKDNRGQHRLH